MEIKLIFYKLQVEFPDICDRLTDEKKTILSLKSKMFEKVWIDSFGGERK